jgi:prepilin peptidase CpaA
MMLKLLPLLPMLLLLAFAGMTDFRARRIPNWLCGALAAAGLIASCLDGSRVGPAGASLGLLLGLAIMLPQFALNALRGGDVKLMAAIGAWVGPTAILLIFVVQALVGMVMVVVQCAWQKRLTRLFRNSAVLAIHAAHVGDLGLRSMEETGNACRSADRPLPYAVPVLVATLMVLLWL